MAFLLVTYARFSLCALFIATHGPVVSAHGADSPDAGVSSDLTSQGVQSQIRTSSQRPYILHEIVSSLRANAFPGLDELRRSVKRDLPELEAALKPMFKTFPLNPGNRVCASGVRYILHRLLVHQHGWFVQGLDPEGRSWNSSSPVALDLLRQLPSGVLRLFEERLNGDGLDIREVAIMAALLEYLVHDEAAQRLRAVYEKTGVAIQGNVQPKKVYAAVDMYMASHITGRNPLTMSRQELVDELRGIEEVFPTWPSTHEFVREIVSRHILLQTDFSSAVLAVVEIGKRFGKKENTECQGLKNTLVNVEDRGTGRVRLEDFYGMALHEGKWNFGESIPYLRQLGALDESNPNNLRVIIPNYINGQSNCVASSQYYSVCCVSECEEILVHLERSLGVPSALPEEIIPLIQGLKSSTVPAHRSISTLMLYRLNSVAQSHGGKVPLHGRLFAQWLHHEYPRECPYPHLSGRTTVPSLQLEVWINQTGLEPTASPEEMQRLAGKTIANWPRAHGKLPMGPVENTPWSYDEELVVPEREADMPMAWQAVHGVTFATFAVVITLGLLLTRTAKSARKALRAAPRSSDKFYMV